MSISSSISSGYDQLPDLFNLPAIRVWLEEMNRPIETVVNISVMPGTSLISGSDFMATIYFQDETKAVRAFMPQELYTDHA